MSWNNKEEILAMVQPRGGMVAHLGTNDFREAEARAVSGNDEKVFFGDLAIKTWTKGKRYIYVINFEDLHYIRYTVDVEDWEDYDNNGGEINTDDIE